jgi:hypothetical protein
MIEKELKSALSNPLLLNVDILKLQHLSMKFSQIDKSEINFKKKINISVSSNYTDVKLNKNEGFYHIEINKITNNKKNYSPFY